MKRHLALTCALLALSLTSCGLVDDGAGLPEGVDSDTAMTVENGVHLEFRVPESYGPTANEDECRELFPDTGGVGTVTDAGPAEPAVVCAEFDDMLFKAELGPSVVTEVDVVYVDYDYGNAAIPEVYVVLDEEGVAAWREALDGSFSSVQVLVDGRVIASAESSLSPNDVVHVHGGGTIEEAETIARMMAAGFDAVE
jgi:hypothetical protein